MSDDKEKKARLRRDKLIAVLFVAPVIFSASYCMAHSSFLSKKKLFQGRHMVSVYSDTQKVIGATACGAVAAFSAGAGFLAFMKQDDD